MFILILILLFLWVVLALLLTAWSLWFQAYLYTEVSSGLPWRGPLAATAVTVLLGLWVVIDYRSVGGDPEGQGHYGPLWNFSTTEDEKPFAELRVPGRNGEEVYKLRPGTGAKLEYRLNGKATGQPLKGRPDKIVVVEGDKRYVFEPERDEKGNFKQRKPGRFSLSQEPEALRYIDKASGKEMTEDRLGQVTSFRGGWLLGNLFLNLVLLGGCFLAWWLLLRFQWPAALAQALILWLVLLLFVLPPVLSRAEDLARQRAAPKAT